jgi:hypothetical protein
MNGACERVELLLREPVDLLGQIVLVDGLPATIAHKARLLYEPGIEIPLMVGR